MPFVEKFLVVWREMSKGKTFLKGGQESTMQHYSMEKFREGVGLWYKGFVIAMFMLPMVIPYMLVLEQHLLEILPEVPMEGTKMTQRKGERPEELEKIDLSQFVSIYQEELLMIKEREKKTIEAVIFLEAGVKEENQIAVAEVINHRKKHPDFPDDLIQVCDQKGQFTTIQDGIPVDQEGNPINMEVVPEMEEVYQKVFVEDDSNETEKLLQKEAFRQGLYSEKYWKGGALYFSNLDGVSEEVYAKGRYDEIKVSVEIGGNTFWRYWG